jgi:hypothetical protein
MKIFEMGVIRKYYDDQEVYGVFDSKENAELFITQYLISKSRSNFSWKTIKADMSLDWYIDEFELE